MQAKMHRARTLRPYARSRQEHPALVSAAESYLGTWGKALCAAGIDSNVYFVHQRWPNRKM
jgi:hypothetical protein